MTRLRQLMLFGVQFTQHQRVSSNRAGTESISGECGDIEIRLGIARIVIQTIAAAVVVRHVDAGGIHSLVLNLDEVVLRPWLAKVTGIPVAGLGLYVSHALVRSGRWRAT